MPGLKITLPLKDIQESLISRITMLEELEAMANASIKKGGAVKTLHGSRTCDAAARLLRYPRDIIRLA